MTRAEYLRQDATTDDSLPVS